MCLLKRQRLPVRVSMPKILQIVLLTYLFLGCARMPKYEPPHMEIPENWNSPVSDGMSMEISEECFHWWEAFNDPILNTLIERASCQNLDLHMAATRILIARLEEKGGKAELYPHIDGSATYGHAQYSQKTLNQVLGNCCPHKGSSSKNINFFEFGFDADWELDLFGMHAHEDNALLAKIQSSKEEFCQLWVTLSAEVAKNYIELRSLQLRLAQVDQNINNQQQNMLLTQSLIQAGFSGTIEEKQALLQVHNFEAQKPLVELGIRKAIHRLSILLGYTPGELFCLLHEPANLPCIPYEKPVGFPSELLRRRPDIRKAERELAAATERVASAVAAQFPRLTLTGFIGEIGTFQSNGLTWFAGPRLLQPIFNSRMLKQDVHLNKILTQQALYNYQKTVLEALEEAENAISSFHYELSKNRQLAQALKISQEAYQSSYQLYERGFKNYLEVLVTQRAVLDAEEAFWNSQRELLYHYVALYKALGGSWEPVPEATWDDDNSNS